MLGPSVFGSSVDTVDSGAFRVLPTDSASADGAGATDSEGQGLQHAKDAADRVLLWIDDEIAPDGPEIRALTLDGYRVDCAVTGATGIQLARTRRYDAIILDLRLPDISGLAVLARLEDERLATPICVLTGFGDIETAHLAGRLGAVAFRTKPVFIDDLIGMVGRVIDDAAIPRRETDRDNRAGAAVHAVAAVLEHLEAVMRARPAGSAFGSAGAPDPPENAAALKRALVTALIRAAADPALPVPCFLVCARAFRRVVASDSDEPPRTVAALAKADITATLASDTSEPRVAAVIAKLDADMARGHRPTEEEIARDLNVDPAHLGRLIHSETGLRFREWRLGFVMKTSVHFLISGDDRIKQIACGFLGFAQETQFNREFRELFGLSPGDFRRAWKTERPSDME